MSYIFLNLEYHSLNKQMQSIQRPDSTTGDFLRAPICPQFAGDTYVYMSPVLLHLSPASPDSYMTCSIAHITCSLTPVTHQTYVGISVQVNRDFFLVFCLKFLNCRQAVMTVEGKLLVGNIVIL